MSKPTYQDANLMLQFAQWGASIGTQKAMSWISSDKYIPDFAEFVKKYPPGSKQYARVSTLCGWYETLGTLYKQGLLNEELIFDWLAVHLIWDRVEGFAIGFREQTGEPRIFENFEALAKASKNY